MRKKSKKKQNRKLLLGHYVGVGDNKGKLITPLNDLLSKFNMSEVSWHYDSVPEYIWLGLILSDGNRDVKLIECYNIINRLREICGEPNITLPKFSVLLNLDKDKQESFFNYLKDINVLKSISPLSYFNFDNALIFNGFIENYTKTYANPIKVINNFLSDISDKDSTLLTDLQYIISYTSYTLVTATNSPYEPLSLNTYLNLPVNSIEFNKQKGIISGTLINYELIYKLQKPIKNNVKDCFWKELSLATDCDITYLKIINENNIDLKEYKKHIYTKLKSFNDFYITNAPLDLKLITLLGMLTYSYKLISELIDYDLENTLSGRSLFRSVADNYMMTKYLILEEENHADIWSQYQEYGLSKYKLIYERFADKQPNLETNHVDFNYIDALVSEYKSKDFLDINFKFFDKGSIKDKFVLIGESDLYDYCYDYDTQFDHGFWGAIRESSILKCNSLGHRSHGVPDIDNKQKMRSVSHDCVLIMDKHLALLEDLFQ